jgi:hypothetical protein
MRTVECNWIYLLVSKYRKQKLTYMYTCCQTNRDQLFCWYKISYILGWHFETTQQCVSDVSICPLEKQIIVELPGNYWTTMKYNEQLPIKIIYVLAIMTQLPQVELAELWTGRVLLCNRLVVKCRIKNIVTFYFIFLKIGRRPPLLYFSCRMPWFSLQSTGILGT